MTIDSARLNKGIGFWLPWCGLALGFLLGLVLFLGFGGALVMGAQNLMGGNGKGFNLGATLGVGLPSLQLGLGVGLVIGTAAYEKKLWTIMRNAAIAVWVCASLDFCFILVLHPY